MQCKTNKHTTCVYGGIAVNQKHTHQTGIMSISFYLFIAYQFYYYYYYHSLCFCCCLFVCCYSFCHDCINKSCAFSANIIISSSSPDQHAVLWAFIKHLFNYIFILETNERMCLCLLSVEHSTEHTLRLIKWQLCQSVFRMCIYFLIYVPVTAAVASINIENDTKLMRKLNWTIEYMKSGATNRRRTNKSKRALQRKASFYLYSDLFGVTLIDCQCGDWRPGDRDTDFEFCVWMTRPKCIQYTNANTNTTNVSTNIHIIVGVERIKMSWPLEWHCLCVPKATTTTEATMTTSSVAAATTNGGGSGSNQTILLANLVVLFAHETVMS